MGNLEALSKTRASIAMMDRNTNNSYLLDISATQAALVRLRIAGGFSGLWKFCFRATRATGDIKGIFCKETYPNESSWAEI